MSTFRGGGYSATRLADGRVLVSGGFGEPSGYLATAETYDPVQGTWSLTASMSTAHHSHRATLLADGRVLVSGGNIGDRGDARAELYSPFVVATTKQSCWSKGWQRVRRADGTAFRNRGDCIRYVRIGK